MAELVADTKRKVYGSLPEQINLISANAVAGATTIELEMSVEGISPGTLVSSGLNVWFVRGVNANTNTLTVIPGYEGAPQAAVQIGDFVYIKPRTTDWFLFNEVNSVIRSMSSPQNGLYRIGTFELTADTVWQTYEIPTEAQGMVGIISIKVLEPSSDDLWVSIPDRYYRWQAEENLIRMLYNVPASSTLYVTYKAPFVAATAMTDDVVDDLGLSASMIDIPPLGAAAALLRTTEARRGQVGVQTDPRRAEDVQRGANGSAAMMFEQQYRDRVGEEHLRLIQRTGIYRGI